VDGTVGYRILNVTRPAKINVRNSQLVINDGEEYEFPVEDVSVLMLEDRRITITAYALESLCSAGGVVYICDGRHLPAVYMTAYNSHSRQADVYDKQFSLSAPLRKRLWQKIVVRKIKNQAKCLELLGKNHTPLENAAEGVVSGDTTNRESYAAAYYFCELFGEGFTRSEETPINASLDYGYSVIRGVLARSVAAYGFLPAKGLHHHNSLNNFNLADDLMEPFRPLVDYAVYCMQPKCNPDKKVKQYLISLLNTDIFIRGKKQTVLNAADIVSSSLVTAVNTKNSDALQLPVLIRPEQHEFV